MAPEYVVYDGPGILSDSLKSQPSMKCSSFQCLVYLLTEGLLSPESLIFKFCSKPLSISENISIGQDTNFIISLQMKISSTDIWTFFLDTNYGFQVNAL